MTDQPSLRLAPTDDEPTPSTPQLIAGIRRHLALIPPTEELYRKRRHCDEEQ